MMRFIAAAAVAFVGLGSSAFADSIEWEVVHPFRFFKYDSDFEIHRIAYESIKHPVAPAPSAAPTILKMDELLNNKQWWDEPLSPEVTARYGDSTLNTPRKILMALRGKEKRPAGAPELAAKYSGSSDHDKRLAAEYDFRRLGWASLLFPFHQAADGKNINFDAFTDGESVAVCWNRGEQLHTNCRLKPDDDKDDSYIKPSHHIVSMKLAGGQSGLTCAWTVEEGSGSAYVGASDGPSLSAPCDRAVRLRVPFEKKVAVKVSPGGGAPVTEYVKVHDILSVSIGDSFTSGEGNPDVPAKMKWTSTDQDPVTSGGYSSAIPGYIPLRKRDGDYFAAQWIDRACHRSAYSYPIRSAIQLALNHPHRAVTFLGYGCSGAEINEGLFGAYQGPEKTSKQDMPNYKKAQLSLMLNELCVSQPATDVDEKLEEWEEDARIKNGRYRFGNDEADAVSDAAFKCPAGKGFKRPVDVLSLGIGGNDVGFAKWIAASITKYNGGMDLAFLPIMKDDPDCNATNRTSCDVTEGRWRRFKARLALLRKFLSERVVYRVPEQQPVVVFTYPDTVADTTTTCKTGNAGMTVADLEMICLWDEQKQGSREINALGKIGYFVKNKLNTEIASFAKAAPPEKQWKLATDADDFIGDFKGRNFCATLNTPAEPSSACNDLQKNRELQMSASVLDTQKAIDETLLIPRKSGEVWKPFDPAINFSPYHHRHRWLRTVNDVYMLINQQPAQTRQSIDVTLLGLAQPALHGAFHPTAQAHARVADSFATSAETVIQKPQ